MAILVMERDIKQGRFLPKSKQIQKICGHFLKCYNAVTTKVIYISTYIQGQSSQTGFFARNC